MLSKTNQISYQICVDVGMADQVKLLKAVDIKQQGSIADTSVANTERLSHSYRTQLNCSLKALSSIIGEREYSIFCMLLCSDAFCKQFIHRSVNCDLKRF